MSDFKQQLALSEDKEALTILDDFYRQQFNVYKIERVKYDESSLGRSLQHAGVDTVLFVDGDSIKLIEEKICLHPAARYMFIEYETHNHAGWAVDPRKHSHGIVFIFRNFVYLFNYNDFREFCITNKELLLNDVGEPSRFTGKDDNNLCAKVHVKDFLDLYSNAGLSFVKEAVAL